MTDIDMTRLDIAESTLMALRPIGADYLGTEPHGLARQATVREIDGTLRRGIGPTDLLAVQALIGWYSDSTLDSQYTVVYDPSDGSIRDRSDG